MTSVFEESGVSTVLSQHLEPSILAEKCVHVLVVLQRSRHSSADSSAVEPPMSLMVPVVVLSPTRLGTPPLMLMSYMKHGAGVEGGGGEGIGASLRRRKAGASAAAGGTAADSAEMKRPRASSATRAADAGLARSVATTAALGAERSSARIIFDR